MTRRRLAPWVWAAVALAAALRITVLVRLASPGADWTGDARVYLRIAEGLRSFELVPDAWIWPPGYPLLGAVLSFAGGADHGLLLASLLCGMALPALVLLAGRRRPVAAGVAALILGFTPELVLAAAQPLSEAAALFVLALAAVLLERALRTGSWKTGATAGAVAALAVLTRPESLLAVGLLGTLAATHGKTGPAAPGRLRAAAAAAVVLLLATAPYVTALHSASGAWALTLKGQLNLRKMEVYQGEDLYGEMRAAWGRALDGMRDASGDLDPAKIAGASFPRDFLLSGALARSWWIHVLQGFPGNPPWIPAVAALGLIGLAWPGPGGRERAIAAAVSAPFLAVPVFLTPTGRFLLPLLPGVAWGVGCVAERARHAIPDRAQVPAALGAIALVVAGGALGTRDAAFDATWSRLAGRVETALARGHAAEAESALLPALDRQENEPRTAVLLGRIREAQGDLPAAERAYRRSVELGNSPLRLADLVARQGRFAEAEQLLRPIRRSPPDDFTYWGLTANLASAGERWDEAADAFRRAEELGGPPQQIALNRGIVLARAGRREEALRELRRAASGPDGAVADRATAELERMSRP